MRFLWMFAVVFRVLCDDDTTLSTTTPRAYTEFPKPTLHSPTRFKNDVGDPPLDLFRWKAIDSRRRADDIWAWDLFCHLQPMKGNCNDEIIRYYYDAQMDSCHVFNYTGCQGNKNNFETIVDCERRCKGANFMGVNENRLPTVCYLQADSGLCLAFMSNYYYDVNNRVCKEFTYGGCGGNLNRFETKAECEEHCKPMKKMTPTTTTTTATGPSTTKQTRTENIEETKNPADNTR